MARLHLAFLLLFITVFAVIVSAADKAPASTAAAPTSTTPSEEDVGGDIADAPTDDNAIGTTDDDADVAAAPGDDDVAVAGPIGSDSSYANYPPPQNTSGSNDLPASFGFASIAAIMVGSLVFF